MTTTAKIDKAARKFKFVYNSKNLKFKYLPEWVLSEATYFENEVNKLPRNHKIYKRGALIFVDFGVNVGNELSGHHFAIVLNNKDSKNNGVLTVVPVSSKSNQFSVQLDGLISDKSLKLLGKIAENIVSEYQQVQNEQQLATIEKKSKELNRIISTYSRFNKVSYAKCLDIRTISKNRILKINQFDPVGQITVSTDTLNEIDKILSQHFIGKND